MSRNLEEEHQPLLGDLTARTLAETTYHIDVARLDQRHSSRHPVVGALKTAIMIILTPVLIVSVGAIATVFMWIGPDAIKQRLVSVFLPRLCHKVGILFQPERDELLKGCSGRVLDVGCGGGAYMRYFHNADAIVALEPVQSMHSKIRSEASNNGIEADRLTLLSIDIESYIQQYGVNDKFDWIILGNVLCEVNDPISTLQAVDALIQPRSGRIYYCEHIGCPKHTWKRRWQDWMNPFWKTLSYGCNSNRDSLEYISTLNDWEVISWQYSNFTVGLGPFVLGLARKK
jgi:SAM-dependent methyltransferase